MWQGRGGGTAPQGNRTPSHMTLLVLIKATFPGAVNSRTENDQLQEEKEQSFTYMNLVVAI